MQPLSNAPSIIDTTFIFAMNISASFASLAFRYLLFPLNIAMIIWIILMNHAFVRPTALPTSYPLRSHGYWNFTVTYLCLCLFTVFVGLTNIYVVYSAFTKVPRRLKKFKSASTFSCCRSTPFYKAYAFIVLLLLGSYGLIGSLAFRDLFTHYAYAQACDGYLLMAEVYVQPEFPEFDGTPGSPTASASSSIRFYKEGRFMFTMDVVRQWNQTLGFEHNLDAEGAKHDPNWGAFELVLRVPDGSTPNYSLAVEGFQYFNITQVLQDQIKGVFNPALPPSSIASITYSLLNLTYLMTFTNTTAPGFPPITKKGSFSPRPLSFMVPELGLEQSGMEWRFTDHVCLPPRVLMRGKYHMEVSIYGGAAYDCQYYRYGDSNSARSGPLQLTESYQDVRIAKDQRQWRRWTGVEGVVGLGGSCVASDRRDRGIGVRELFAVLHKEGVRRWSALTSPVVMTKQRELGNKQLPVGLITQWYCVGGFPL